MNVRDEGGQVLVLTAMGLLALIGFAALAIDVSRFFTHKRHLQTQADAAVLAAAGEATLPCDDAAIVDRAREYAGARRNPQVERTPDSRIDFALNSRTFAGQGAPVDDTVRPGQPCKAAMIDVKLTERDVPWFFRVGSLARINAHARVELVQTSELAGVIPVAVPEAAPRRMAVEVVNEASGARLGFVELTRNGRSGGLAVWDNVGSTLPVPIPAGVKDVGVKLVVSSTSSLTCGEPLVECYDYPPATTGPHYLRAWSTSAATGPSARDVSVVSGSCSGTSFTSDAADCTVGLVADVRWSASGTVTPPGSPGTTTKVIASFRGVDHPLTWSAAQGTWSIAGLVVPPGAGSLPVGLRWSRTSGTSGSQTCTAKNPCEGSFGTVQRVRSGSDAATGAVRLLEVSKGGSRTSSLQACDACTHDLTFRVGMQASLEVAQSVADAPVSLRVTGGSQNQSLDCDPEANTSLEEQIARSCDVAYRINKGSACPKSIPELLATPKPWECVANRTGTKRNEPARGFNTRILGSPTASTCTNRNRWPDFPDLDPDDPRIVQLLVTPYGSFSSSGGTTVPVTNFAAFYVTGWSSNGSGVVNPCRDAGDDPVPEGGDVVGHFIKYVQRRNEGNGGTEKCDLSAFGSCVAVLTR